MQTTFFNSSYADPITISGIIGVEHRGDGSRVLITADGNRLHLAADWLEMPEDPTPNGAAGACPSAFDDPSLHLWHEPTAAGSPE